jgi:hypothetical protein
VPGGECLIREVPFMSIRAVAQTSQTRKYRSCLDVYGHPIIAVDARSTDSAAIWANDA